jgi:hypothetical protein
MLVHTVYFWLEKDLDSAKRTAFADELKRLTTIATVCCRHVAVPAATRRPVVDRTWDYMLVVAFNDLAGHDAYQADPLHHDFLARCGTWWSRVVVYDAETI